MSDKPVYLSCNYIQAALNKGYPRTCRVCGLGGPCKNNIVGDDFRDCQRQAQNLLEGKPPEPHLLSLHDFKEGQWWVEELDHMARTQGAPTDYRRAVSVVHNLLKFVEADRIAKEGQ